jgi:hypothetical protein
MSQTVEQKRAWRAANRERDRAYSAKYRATNREKELARHKRRREQEKAEELQSWTNT